MLPSPPRPRGQSIAMNARMQRSKQCLQDTIFNFRTTHPLSLHLRKLLKSGIQYSIPTDPFLSALDLVNFLESKANLRIPFPIPSDFHLQNTHGIRLRSTVLVELWNSQRHCTNLCRYASRTSIKEMLFGSIDGPTVGEKPRFLTARTLRSMFNWEVASFLRTIVAWLLPCMTFLRRLKLKRGKKHRSMPPIPRQMPL